MLNLQQEKEEESEWTKCTLRYTRKNSSNTIKKHKTKLPSSKQLKLANEKHSNIEYGGFILQKNCAEVLHK